MVGGMSSALQHSDSEPLASSHTTSTSTERAEEPAKQVGAHQLRIALT
jgi:hypothetical protein